MDLIAKIEQAITGRPYLIEEQKKMYTHPHADVYNILLTRERGIGTDSDSDIDLQMCLCAKEMSGEQQFSEKRSQLRFDYKELNDLQRMVKDTGLFLKTPDQVQAGIALARKLDYGRPHYVVEKEYVYVRDDSDLRGYSW